MYLAGWLHYPALEKQPFVGDVLCVPAVHCPPARLYAIGCPLCGLHRSFCCGRLTTGGGLVGVAGPGPVGCLFLKNNISISWIRGFPAIDDISQHPLQLGMANGMRVEEM